MNNYLQIDANRFDPPKFGKVDILFIAGEHSGDQHGAEIIEKILQKDPNKKICMIGGPAMEKLKQAQFLFNLADSSVVGFVEVLRNYNFFKKIFDDLMEWISFHSPKRIVFIDYPGFNLRIAKSLFQAGISKASGGKVELYYYIAPQVWAWKAKRRFSMAEHIDSLGVIFPFEIEVFSDTKLQTHFVGHPFVQNGFKIHLVYDHSAPILLLPGSRIQAVTRIYPILLKSFEKVLQKNPQMEANVVYPDSKIKSLLEEIQSSHISKEIEKKIHFHNTSSNLSASIVLTSSGTMSLKCALAGIPGAIVYKAHPITYWIGKRLVKIPYLGISNILLQKDFYPEFIQNDADPEKIAQWVFKNLEINPSIKEGTLELKRKLHHKDGVSAEDWITKDL